MNDHFRVIAIISAFNEGDIISSVIAHLVEHGVDVYLIDNHSTDDTVQQASRWLGRGLIEIETFPDLASTPEKHFAWTAILKRKVKLAKILDADWIIHHDADEIRESPWPGLTLKEAIHWVDTLGYNCIDFRVFNFPPVDDGFRQGNDPRTYFTLFEDARAFDQLQMKCWKTGPQRISLAASGGHEVRFAGRRVFPIRFVLRHYPIRNLEQGRKKVFQERKNRFVTRERARGWHIQYDDVADGEHSFLADPASLSVFDIDRVRFELMLDAAADQHAGSDPANLASIQSMDRG